MTEQQIERIRWLNRAFHADKIARAWVEKRECDRSLAERIRSGLASGTGGSGSDNSTENALLRLAETEHETELRLAELVQIRDEIAQAIATVDDDDMQAILMWHYLMYETFERIAEKMNYSERTVRRKHLIALDKVVLECPVKMCYNDIIEKRRR